MRKETRWLGWGLYGLACLVLAWYLILWFQAPVLKNDLGQTVSTAVPYNKWRLVSYWSDWCNACEEELEALNTLEKTWPQIEILSVHIDLPPVAVLQQFVQQYHLKFRLLQQDPKTFFKLPSFTSIPANFVIDPEGKVYGPFIGKIEPIVLERLINDQAVHS